MARWPIPEQSQLRHGFNFCSKRVLFPFVRIAISQDTQSFRLTSTLNVLGRKMPNLSWHDYLMILSSIAAIAGLIILLQDIPASETNVELVDRILFTMSFAYWLVYCAAVFLRPFILPEWEILSLGLKLTGVLAYLLTVTCVLSLPLHRIAVRQPE